jgi:hypothetical protein
MIAAALVEVGHGRVSPQALAQLVAAGDRAGLAVEAAPAAGLVLQQVFYDYPAWLPDEVRRQSEESGRWGAGGEGCCVAVWLSGCCVMCSVLAAGVQRPAGGCCPPGELSALLSARAPRRAEKGGGAAGDGDGGDAASEAGADA